jgi:hypothetical protein
LPLVIGGSIGGMGTIVGSGGARFFEGELDSTLQLRIGKFASTAMFVRTGGRRMVVLMRGRIEVCAVSDTRAI